MTISTNLSNCLFHENEEIVLETLRVLGNLTRISKIIEVVIEKRIEEAFLILLSSHANYQILSAIIGIFINFTANPVGRKSLLSSSPSSSLKPRNNKVNNEDLMTYSHLVQQFTMILRKLTMNDLHIAILISQVIYYYFLLLVLVSLIPN